VSGGASQAHAGLRVVLLGGFGVEVDGHAVPDGAWRLRKARNLVKLLALSPGFQLHREQLTDALWPDLEPAAAANNLHQVIYAARGALALGGARSALTYLPLRGEVLALGTPVSVDAIEFEKAAGIVRISQREAEYSAAAARYTGELLPEDRYEEWVETRRERLRELFCSLLGDLAALRLAAGDRRGAAESLERLVLEDPSREPAQAQLIRLYLDEGDRSRALRQYEQLRDALRRDLDASPSPETERLRAELSASAASVGTPGTASAAPAAGPSTRTPAAATQIRRLTNVPLALTSLVGRDLDVAGVLSALDAARLVTLTGPGGVGKTRLALAVATAVGAAGDERGHRTADTAYQDGVWFVEVGSAAHPGEVVRRVAQTLRLGELDSAGADSLAAALREWRLVLVLDGCEHLSDACGTLAGALLSVCAGVRVLATSRQSLGVPGERLVPVGPLAAPLPRVLEGRTHRQSNGEELAEYDAVRLFVERARLGRPDFSLTAENAGTVGRICARLDGLPLAIELAAARVRVLSPAQIEERLAQRFELLTSAVASVPARQQTLRATLDWSHALLTPSEATLFRRLAVFPGEWSLDDAEMVCADASSTQPSSGALPPGAVLDVLDRLANKSLVDVRHVSRGPARYRLLETVREYARLELQERGELDAVTVRLRAREAAGKRTERDE